MDVLHFQLYYIGDIIIMQFVVLKKESPIIVVVVE